MRYGEASKVGKCFSVERLIEILANVFLDVGQTFIMRLDCHHHIHYSSLERKFALPNVSSFVLFQSILSTITLNSVLRRR